MRDFLILTRVQLASLGNALAPRSARAGDRRQRRVRMALAATGLTLLALVLAGYFFMTGIGFASAGLSDALPPLAVLASSLASVGFAFVKARGTLFELADFDHVMSLPVARRTVIASRVTAVFAWAILTGAILSVPLYAAYFLVEGPSFGGILVALVTVVLAPGAPVALVIVASFAITAVAARFRRANAAYIAFTLIASCAVVIAVYAFSFSLQGGSHEEAIGTLTELGRMARDSVRSIWPPAGWAADAVAEGSPLALAAFVAVSLAVPALVLEIMQRHYLELSELLSTKGGHRRGHAATPDAGETGTLCARSPLTALVRKELQTLTSIPSYAVNCLFGYLFMLIIAVAIAAIGLRDVLASGVIDGVDLSPEQIDAAIGVVLLLVPWCFGFCAAMSPSAACSCSIEGRAAWITATAPLPVRTILGAKLASNAVPVAATLVVSALIMLASGQIDPLIAIEVVLVGFGIFYLLVNMALLLDARRPNLSWSSPNEVVKRGMPIMIVIFGGMLLSFGGGAGAAALATLHGLVAGHALTIGVGAACLLAGQLIFWRAATSTTLYLS